MAASSSSFSNLNPVERSASSSREDHSPVSETVTYKKAISTLLNLKRRDKSPSDKRMEKLRQLDRFITHKIPTSYHSSTLTKVAFLFKEFYLQKNAPPDMGPRAVQGYPIQEIQELSDPSSYHREQEADFWNAALNDLFPFSSSIEHPFRFAIVKHRELLWDLLQQGSVYRITQPEQLVNLARQLIEKSDEELHQKKTIYIFLTLSPEEKSLSQKDQIAVLTSKSKRLNNALIRYGETKGKRYFENLFTLISLIRGPNDLSLIFFYEDENNLQISIETGAYAPTMIEIHEAIGVNFIPSENFVRLPLPDPLPPHFNINDFTESEAFQSYKNLARQFNPQGEEIQPIAPILASGNYRMIQKLSLVIRKTSDGRSEEFQYMLSESLKRLQILLKKSVKERKSLTKYYILHELIAEEILLLLNLLRPYTPTGFQEIISLLPYTKEFLISPTAIPFSSGIAAFNGAIRSINSFLKRPARIAIADNTYYEICRLTSFQATKVEKQQEFDRRISLLKNEHPTESFREILPQREFPDVFVLSLRSNPSPAPSHHTSFDDVITLLNCAKERQPEGSHLTIILDITNDELYSEEIVLLLNTFNESIQNQSYSFILFRSGHKFIQLGVDKFNAGYAQLHTAKNELKTEFLKQEGSLKGLDYQALCHFMLCSHNEIHHYTKLHQNNARMLQEHLLAITTNEESESGFKIYRNDDAKSYYIQLKPFTSIRPSLIESWGFKNPEQELLVVLADTICLLAAREGISVHLRDSFGFNDTVICDISGTMRISVGSHSPAEMEKLCQIFTLCHTTLKNFTPETSSHKRRSRANDHETGPSLKKERSQSTESPRSPEENGDEDLFTEESGSDGEELEDEHFNEPFQQLISKINNL